MIRLKSNINSKQPIQEQKPNPPTGRKPLGDVVFDILGLTGDEKMRSYLAVCKLVKNRLEKVKSV